MAQFSQTILKISFILTLLAGSHAAAELQPEESYLLSAVATFSSEAQSEDKEDDRSRTKGRGYGYGFGYGYGYGKGFSTSALENFSDLETCMKAASLFKASVEKVKPSRSQGKINATCTNLSTDQTETVFDGQI